MNLLRWISMIGVLAVMMPATLTGQDSQTANLAEARKVIQEGYIEWGKALVAIDKNTFEKMSAPDLYVQFKDRRLTRQQFSDKWVILFSEEVGQERWKGAPPLANW